MSKKKNKKNKKNKEEKIFFKNYGRPADKKGDKKKNKKSSAYEAPTYKTMKPSVSKKEVKEAKHTITEPISIPERFIKHRRKCNHVAKELTVAEYKALTPNYAAYTPMLDTAVEVFGEDNIAICDSCYDVLVNTALIDVGDIRRAIAVLYLSANAVVSHKRLKGDEIKVIATMKDRVMNWASIARDFSKLAEKGAFMAGDATTPGKVTTSALSDEQMAALNKSGTKVY